jgi:hypothetical protein
MCGVFITQCKLAGQVYVAFALDDWKAFVEKYVELDYLSNMEGISKTTSGK